MPLERKAIQSSPRRKVERQPWRRAMGVMRSGVSAAPSEPPL